MPQRADLRRATSSSGPRRNRIAAPTWADEIFGKHKAAQAARLTSEAAIDVVHTVALLHWYRHLALRVGGDSNDLTAAVEGAPARPSDGRRPRVQAGCRRLVRAGSL